MLTDPAIRSQIKTAQKLYQRLVENMPEPSTTQALKQAGAKATKILSDGGTGLNLAVYGSTGNATWQFYHRTGGKQRKVTIGRYPAIPLGAARDQVRQWRDAIDRGQDPFAKKTGEKITVTELCQRYIESHAVYELRARSLERALGYLGLRQKDGALVATARHEYFDLNEGTWTIPEEQEGTKGIGNLLPLTDTIRTIVRDTPHKSGYLISNDGGRRPVCLAGGKRRLDAIIAAKGTIAPWRLHDLRRTFRTLSSAVAIPAGDATRERLIGHKIGGMDEIYNQHAYFEEKGEALRMMEAKIRSIVTPASCASR